MFEQQRIELDRAKSQYSTAVKSIDSAVRAAISRDPECLGEANALRGDYCVVPDEAVMSFPTGGAIEAMPPDVREKQLLELEQAHKQLLIDYDALVHQYKVLVAESAAVAEASQTADGKSSTEGQALTSATGEEQGD